MEWLNQLNDLKGLKSALLIIGPIIVLAWSFIVLTAGYHGWALAKSTFAWIAGFVLGLLLGGVIGTYYFDSVVAGAFSAIASGILGGLLIYRRLWSDYYINTIVVAGVLGGTAALYIGWDDLHGRHWVIYVLVFFLAFSVVGAMYWKFYLRIFPGVWKLWNAFKVAIASIVLINADFRQEILFYMQQKVTDVDRWIDLVNGVAVDIITALFVSFILVYWLTYRQDFTSGWRELVEFARIHERHNYRSYWDMFSSALSSIPRTFLFGTSRPKESGSNVISKAVDQPSHAISQRLDMAGQWCLSIYRDQKHVNSHSLEMGSYILGRDREADIVITDPGISRIHLEIELSKDKGLLLRDLDSAGGTWKGGTDPVSEIRVGLDDWFLIGQTQLLFHSG